MKKEKNMNRTYRNILLGPALLICLTLLGYAQDAKTDRAVVPLTDPAKPALIKADVLMGSITVKGYDGKEVIFEAKVRERSLPDVDEEDDDETRAALAAEDQEEKDKAAKIAGMKKIGVVSTGLEVEESNNVVSISAESWKYAVDITIQVPRASSLELHSTNDGDIVVENVSGEIEVENVNGSNTLRNISGNAVVNTVNGDVTVTMTRVTPDKPMSFSSMNGDVDVTLPADIKANVKMKSQQGEIYSDFDITLKPVPQKAEEVSKSGKGKYRISFEKNIYGAINGGGPEYAFNTFNGDVFIRKGK
ncbi:hypothetical protein D4R89_04010 [bacterium]|nr:MAG: hypothetical protein D4R89_04010 [bacterium]